MMAQAQDPAQPPDTNKVVTGAIEELMDYKNNLDVANKARKDQVPEQQRCQCTCDCDQRRHYRSNAWLDAETRSRVIKFTAPYEFCKECMDNYHLDSTPNTHSWNCIPDPAVKDVDEAPDGYCQSLKGEFHARCGLRPRRFNESQDEDAEEPVVDDKEMDNDNPCLEDDGDGSQHGKNKDDDVIVHESEVQGE
jgi:hypothetical protein